MHAIQDLPFSWTKKKKKKKKKNEIVLVISCYHCLVKYASGMTDGTYITYLILHNRLKHLEQLKKYDIDTCSRPNSNCNNLLRQWELCKWHKSIKFYLIHVMASPKFSITHEEFSPIRNTKLSDIKGAPIDGFLLNALKSLLGYPQYFLDL